MKLIISKGYKGKMEGMLGITSSPLSPFCYKMSQIEGSICQQCYARWALISYRAWLKPIYLQNTILLSQAIIEPPKLNALFVRFNSHGELVNSVHFENLLRICDRNPQTTFALWTKRPSLVTYKPKNMTLVYSSPMLNKRAKKPSQFDSVFTVYQHQLPDDAYHCPNKCITCLACYKPGVAQVAELLRPNKLMNKGELK